MGVGRSGGMREMLKCLHHRFWVREGASASMQEETPGPFPASSRRCSQRRKQRQTLLVAFAQCNPTLHERPGARFPSGNSTSRPPVASSGYVARGQASRPVVKSRRLVWLCLEQFQVIHRDGQHFVEVVVPLDHVAVLGLLVFFVEDVFQLGVLLA